MSLELANEQMPCKCAKIVQKKVPVAVLPAPTGSIACEEANSVTKRIPLTHGRFALVDDNDYVALSARRWVLNHNGYAWTFLFKDKNKNNKWLMMHNAIMDPPAGMEVDHIDLDKLNNTRANLRVVTHAENSVNQKKREKYARRPTTSIYKGVYKEKRTGRYVAEIFVRGRKHSLGTFGGEVEAAYAYDRAALDFHGALARTNFPSEGSNE